MTAVTLDGYRAAASDARLVRDYRLETAYLDTQAQVSDSEALAIMKGREAVRDASFAALPKATTHRVGDAELGYLKAKRGLAFSEYVDRLNNGWKNGRDI